MAKLNKLLLIGGAAAAFYMISGSKKASASKAKPPETYNSEVLEYPGYKIIDCKSIKVTDLNQALEYAYYSGQVFEDKYSLETQSYEIYNILFGSGECLISLINDQNFSQFAYSLLIDFWAGVLSNPYNYITTQFDLQHIDNELSGFREGAKLGEVDTVKDLLKRILEKTGKGVDNPGYIIAAKNLHIYDPEKAFEYAYIVSNSDIYPDWFKNLLGDYSFTSLNKGRSRYNAYNLYTYALIGEAEKNINEPGELEMLKSNLEIAAKSLEDNSFAITPLTDEQIIEIINKYGK